MRPIPSRVCYSLRLAVGFFVLVSGTASAKKPVTAAVTCTVKEDGAATPTVLPTSRIKRLATPITCTLAVTDAPTDSNGVHASIRTYRKVKDAANGKTLVVEGPEHFQVDVQTGVAAAPLAVDLKRLNDKGIGDYESCRDFDIVALVHDDYSNVLWKKTLSIKQPCPKPPPVKFDVTCTATGDDGQPVDVPDPKSRRLAAANIDCRLDSPRSTARNPICRC